jgi:CheY-like chemotaxis protein
MRSRILIVDDHDGFRAIARAMLKSEGFDVVGEAVDGGEAVSAVSRLRPGIVLLDVHLADMDGFAVSELLARLPGPPVVVLISSRPIADLRRRVRDSPVAGFWGSRGARIGPEPPTSRDLADRRAGRSPIAAHPGPARGGSGRTS